MSRMLALILWPALLAIDLQEMHDHPGWLTYVGVSVAVCGVAVTWGRR